jgi:hypothetical protein
MLAVLLAVVALDADRSGDRPEAVARLDDHPALATFTEPATIRVWRRALDGSTASCSGRVDVIPFEQYVKGVLPHEWIASWDDEALKAGAVAIRTYAAYWVNAGGKYTCADIDDTTASQVYQDDTNPKTNADVDATAGEVVLDASGSLQFAEYSAENGDPTADGVDDPVCAGQSVNGHGHGVCQWGTERWAQAGKAYDWMLTHYYPGASVVGTSAGAPDAGAGGADASAGGVDASTAGTDAGTGGAVVGDLGGGCNAGGGGAGCAILVLGALGLLRTGARRRLR